MLEDEIGDKGGGTVIDKSVNIVNEDSLGKDIQLTTALEKTESLVSTRNASLVGLRRMMFENISHTDDEKSPKLRKFAIEKSFPQSQVKCDIKSDVLSKGLSETDSVSVVESEHRDARRLSDISFIDKESDHDEDVNNSDKIADIDHVSLSYKEILSTVIKDSETALAAQENANEETSESNVTNNSETIIDKREFIDDSVKNDGLCVETKNISFETPVIVVEARNDAVCDDLVEATNDAILVTTPHLQDEIVTSSPIPPVRARGKDKTLSPVKPSQQKELPATEYPEDLNPFADDDQEVHTSTNPFGSDEDDDEEDNSLAIPTPQKRMSLTGKKVSSNPFGSDSEEELADNSAATPIPMPRTLRTPEPSPLPRSKFRASSGSVGSASSTMSRKKKPAPPPPSLQSPKTPKASRPPPVPRTVSPSQPPPLPLSSPPPSSPSSLQYTPPSPTLEKNDKDYVNRQRKISDTSSIGSYVPNKSTYGQWKRKKGPAPARPIPQRRLVKPMPLKDIRQELDDIEIKQQELERQGVKLEQTIRDKFEQDSSLTPYVEEMVLQLFELVNEKNEMFRRQAELMYLRRQHNLEEEHAELEYQIRCLMLCPDHNKTDSDKAREEELIQRLVEVVERRDEIIQCLEMDRIREVEEDRSVNTQLGIFSAAMGSELDLRTKQEKKGRKGKKDKKLMKKEVFDVDKDLDEMDKERKKHKKKWFTLHHK